MAKSLTVQKNRKGDSPSPTTKGYNGKLNRESTTLPKDYNKMLSQRMKDRILEAHNGTANKKNAASKRTIIDDLQPHRVRADVVYRMIEETKKTEMEFLGDALDYYVRAIMTNPDMVEEIEDGEILERIYESADTMISGEAG